MTEHLFGAWPRICFPGGHFVDLPRAVFNALDWQPPPPPPWEPEIGQPAYMMGSNHVVRGIYNGFAWCEDLDGDMFSVPLSDLHSPKGGA